MTDISTSNNLNSPECNLIDACGENAGGAQKTRVKDSNEAVERVAKEIFQTLNENKDADKDSIVDVCSSTTEKILSKDQVRQSTDISTCDSSESNAFTGQSEPMMRLAGSIDDSINTISGDVTPTSGTFARNTLFKKLQRSPRSLKLFPKNQDEPAPNAQHNWKSAFSKLFRLKRKSKEAPEPETSDIFTNIPLTSSNKYEMQSDSKTKSLGKLFRRPRSEILHGQGGSLGRGVAAPVFEERSKGWGAFLSRFRHKSHAEVVDKVEADVSLDSRSTSADLYAAESKPLTIFEPNAKTTTIN